jgi:hypothetical protein
MTHQPSRAVSLLLPAACCLTAIWVQHRARLATKGKVQVIGVCVKHVVRTLLARFKMEMRELTTL